MCVCVLYFRGTARSAGFLIRSWNAGGGGSAAVLYDWERACLETVYREDEGNEITTLADFSPEAEGIRRVGGPVDARPGEPIHMRVCLATSHLSQL